MKKFLAILLIALTVLSLASCGNTYIKVTNQLAESIPSGYYYTEAQIMAVQATHDKHEHFEGKITSMADFSTLGEGVELYIYVYEFELESDAEYWYDSVSVGWRYARQKGTVVIYGTNPIINDIKL